MHGRVGDCNADGATPAASRTPKTRTWFQRLSPMWPQVGHKSAHMQALIPWRCPACATAMS